MYHIFGTTLPQECLNDKEIRNVDSTRLLEIGGIIEAW